MMKSSHLYMTFLVVMCVILTNCERNPYVLAEEVEIEYYDTMRIGDWISIDGVKFTHQDNYEILKEDSLNSQLVYEMKVLPTTNQKVIVPGVDNHQFDGVTNRSDIAFALFKALSLSEKNEIGQFYGFKGHTLNLAHGKFIFYRKDGEKIKVMTSDGYGGAVRKLK